MVGCILLVNPIILPGEAWADQPSDRPVRPLTPIRCDLALFACRPDCLDAKGVS